MIFQRVGQPPTTYITNENEDSINDGIIKIWYEKHWVSKLGVLMGKQIFLVYMVNGWSMDGIYGIYVL